MSRLDFTSYRLCVDAPLEDGARIELTREQANYLVNVLRLAEGARLLVFNGGDGEWRAALGLQGKKSAFLRIEAPTRPQESLPDLDYIFAPLKHARLDYMAQKAVEMGARRLRPALTRRSQASRVNLDRMRANVVEAAEQCGLLALAEVLEEERLERSSAAMARGPAADLLRRGRRNRRPARSAARWRGGPWKFAVLIGPEGGFDEAEREMLARIRPVVRLSLGPRVLRADTAAVAALALVQAALGDWRG